MSVPQERREELAEALIENILYWKNPYDIFDAKADVTLEEIRRNCQGQWMPFIN